MALLTAASIVGCGNKAEPAAEEVSIVKKNSIYHWKTVFDIDSAECAFLKRHNIERLYLRMFDVALEPDFLNGTSEVVPIATTKFVSPIPADVEVVPVTYITLDALRSMAGNEAEYAELIVERLLAMSSYNGCGEIREVQLDCDWTTSTKASYCKLCQLVKDLLQTRGIELSVTIRLHQLGETPPPAHRGVLMLYNTGALKNPATKNSILNIADVEPYLDYMDYHIPLAYAYPTFGWGVKFNNNKFVAIVSDSTTNSPQEYIRYERATAKEILAVKQIVESHLEKPANGNILYHLDNSQLKNYTDDEISEILAY